MAAIRKRVWTTSAGEVREKWVIAYRDKDRVQRLETFGTRAEAVARRNEIEPALRVGTHTPITAKVTVREAAEAWIKGGEAKRLEHSTLVQRREHVDRHILPLLGAETRLAKLSKPQVVAFRDQLASTRSPALARKVWTSFRSLHRDARERGMVAHDPTADVRIEVNGRHKKPPLRVGTDIPTPAEVRTLIEAAEGYTRALLVTLVFAGLRISEALGLRWGDVDLKAQMIRIGQRANKWGTLGPVKSETSYRAIPMAPIVASTFEAWRGARILPADALVFATAVGTVQSQANIWNRVMAPLQRKTGVVDRHGKAKYGAHAFRHFCASWWLSQGENIKRVSTLLGHSNTVITATTYEHLLPQANEHERFAAGERALLGS